MKRYDIINGLIDKYGFQDYLEIGLDLARNYLKIRCKNKECVDPYVYEMEESEEVQCMRRFVEANILTYKMTSDDFFASIPPNKMYDIIFIDGLHHEEQVGRDIINSLKHLRNGGIIVCHDCLPESYEAQLDTPITETWNGSTWKAIPMLKFQGITYVTVNVDCGCCVIQYDGDKESLFYPPKASYNYEDVFTNPTIRNIVMNVVNEESFNNFLIPPQND